KQLRAYVSQIFVIDDLADRVHDCDLLLDQNLVEGMETRYDDKVPSSCGKMLGPEYALLQPIYAELHDRIPPREGPIRRILIFFGGVDQNNLTGMALSAVMELNHPDIKVDAVISEKSPFYSVILDKTANRPNIYLHSNLPSLASLMAKADLAIGASGTTSWERLCLGLPTIVITTAENQKAIAHGLEQQNLITWLGHADAITEKMIRESISELLVKGELRDWSSHCSQTVDGLGVVRVFTARTISADTELHARRASLFDEKKLLSWANDPITRKNSFTMDEISPDRHHQWFYDKLRDMENVFLYIIETEDQVPIGQVRFERNGELWEIYYSLATEFRNRGGGRALLKTGLCEFRKEHIGAIVLGWVKEENSPSCKVFESLNFSSNLKGGVAYQRLL
ncbi:UDP-2,4-diacetamido-2,4,6-trideoxy-beta-L-altropyranose hydrolase, partial [Methanospirillum hungatei]|uniref:UDP-2,4-diacetamido-2,4, 6-trideoxy-beta-L-altropyranose hydrolase n=1 Tax=Methanospirillum hungatei TaxID=2203 RepID=UPI0026F0F589